MNKLKHYRSLANLSTRQLGKLVNLSATTVLAYEKGTFNSLKTKKAIFNGLKGYLKDLTFFELWGENEKGTVKAVPSVRDNIGDKDSHHITLTQSLSFIEPKNASTLTMSTREIADLCGKEHRNVTRDFSKVCWALGFNVLNFERIYVDTKGRTQKEYLLDKELSITLVTGYNAVVRHKVVKRWLELESQNQKPLAPPTPTELALLVIKAEEEKQALLLENKEKDEKIEILNNKFTSGVRIPEFCRELNGININKIQNFLVRKGWLFKTDTRGEFKTTHYSRVKCKYLIEKKDFPYPRAKFKQSFAVLTQKGAIKLMDMYMKGELNEIMVQDWDGQLVHSYAQLGEVA